MRRLAPVVLKNSGKDRATVTISTHDFSDDGSRYLLICENSSDGLNGLALSENDCRQLRDILNKVLS